MRFTDAVDRALAEIRKNPLKYEAIHRRIRRAFTRGFPYGVFFRVESDVVVVLAILHLARDPRLWMERG